ncbi:MAG TPA: iron-sulfur cluster assembly scaffold protein [Candidatus Limiplasma sp.]|nr:iron-sulfur cluster assembly scaffold protein [Candidatus Limiplasma sp.]
MGCFDFSDIVLDHFMNPRNIGGMDDANGFGAIGEPSCGDALMIYIQVNDNVITDISFLVHGCVAAIATSSMTTVLAKGKTLDEAYQITEENITDAMGGLPDHKLHCSLLGPKALKKAIDNYRQNEKHIGWGCNSV